MVKPVSAKKIESWKRLLKKRRDEIGELRDRMQDDIDAMTDLQDCCNRAYESIDGAIAELSELA